MDLASVDLNLLIVFDAMVEHRGVTRAGEAMGRSQPATSAAVARLRLLFDDPLFIKSGLEMKLTPRALELAAPIRRVIDMFKLDILQRTGFDASKSNRTFSIVTSDIGEVMYVPRLISRLSQVASRINIRTLAMPQVSAAGSLESGRADLALGYFPDLQLPGFVQQKLFDISHVCIVREAHAFTKKRMTLKDYLCAAHAVVRPDGREGVYDRALHKRGLRRRVLVELSHFMSLLPLIQGSDMIATVPRGLEDVFRRYGKLSIIAAPVQAPAIEVHQFWHERYHKDPANVWLRSIVHSLFAAQSVPDSSTQRKDLRKKSKA